MSMNRLISAAHAAGYAMAAEDFADPRTIVARVPQSTAVVVRPVHRGVIANAQRTHAAHVAAVVRRPLGSPRGRLSGR